MPLDMLRWRWGGRLPVSPATVPPPPPPPQAPQQPLLSGSNPPPATPLTYRCVWLFWVRICEILMAFIGFNISAAAFQLLTFRDNCSSRQQPPLVPRAVADALCVQHSGCSVVEHVQSTASHAASMQSTQFEPLVFCPGSLRPWYGITSQLTSHVIQVCCNVTLGNTRML